MRQWGRVGCLCCVGHEFLFLRPFAPRPLRRFLATTSALTPARRLFGAKAHEHRPSRAGLPTSRTPPSCPFRLHSPGVPSSSLSHATPQRDEPLRCRAGLHLSYADSPSAPGRIEFVSLRTGHSPPIAPHLASRRRSDRWLRAGERMPGEDLHLSVGVRLQAHIGRLAALAGRPASPVGRSFAAEGPARSRSPEGALAYARAFESQCSLRLEARRSATNVGSVRSTALDRRSPSVRRPAINREAVARGAKPSPTEHSARTADAASSLRCCRRRLRVATSNRASSPRRCR